MTGIGSIVGMVRRRVVTVGRSFYRKKNLNTIINRKNKGGRQSRIWGITGFTTIANTITYFFSTYD